MKIWIINGANLNFLGKRDVKQYGDKNYQALCAMIERKAEEIEANVRIYQSNHEGEIIDKLQEAYENKVDALIINAGAFTHYSYAIRDALEVLSCIKLEVHISHIYRRESFRRNSVIADVCDGAISGFGAEGYLLAMEYVHMLEKEKREAKQEEKGQ